MGAFAVELIAQAGDLQVVCQVRSEDDLEASVLEAEAQVALDLTRAGLGFEHGRRLLQAGLRIVIGTSGVDEGQTAELDRLARKLQLGGCVIPNFSMGSWLQQKLAAEAARVLRSVSIIEAHHPRKLDAPSGSAIQAAEVLAKALGVPTEEIPIQSLRIEGLHAEQRIYLGGPGEVLSLEHRVADRSAYGSGLLHSLRFARDAQGVVRGLQAVLAATDLHTAE
ncbi:MAG: 4-hydroxy-tetrahydrodipicolinate reductase [Planctomycetota bacterium]|jgi:4-hydroxy-tetrahydrodipicolinate reductase